MPSSLLVSQGLSARAVVDPPGRSRGGTGRLLTLFGWLVGPLLAGYWLFDKAFAYIHLPGTPLYVGELVLLVGAVGCLGATGYLRVPVRDDPALALLFAFFLWGFIRFLPGLRVYHVTAIRDFALVYYSLFAFFMAAALARSPQLLGRLIGQLTWFAPWLLVWVPIAVILGRTVSHGPNVPFSGTPIATHKPGDAAIAAMMALAALWLFPARRSARSRGLWSIVALIGLVLAATQNRGGLLSVIAGLAVGLAFFRDRRPLIVRAVVATALLIGVGVLLSVQIAGSAASQGRAFSASQLFANVESIAGVHVAGNQNGTVAGRTELWTEVIDKQISQDKLIDGWGFGPNVAYLSGGVAAEGTPSDPLRSPHNSHLDVLARLGVVGAVLWIALWVGWYWRMIIGCSRLARRGLYQRRRVAVLCLMAVTATLVNSFFDPQLEAAQSAVLLWVALGVGVAVTSFRAWYGDRDVDLGGRQPAIPPGRPAAQAGTPSAAPPLRGFPVTAAPRSARVLTHDERGGLAACGRIAGTGWHRSSPCWRRPAGLASPARHPGSSPTPRRRYSPARRWEW